MNMSQDWKATANKIQAERQAKIPERWRLPPDLLTSITVEAKTNVVNIPDTCGILSQKEIEITGSYTATELLEKLRTKTFSSVEVTTAFCKRAAVAHQLVNCCSEIFFDLALKRARECDDYLARENKILGPLHGLPVSVKDMFHVSGVRTTFGYVSRADDPNQSSFAGITEILYSLGAVFYVKTNASQMGFAFDSHNNLFGRTLNPLNTGLTPGGSSGGESALIALRGSILGIGSDALGSLRVPAHATGIYTIKPSPFRVPTAAMLVRTKGIPSNPPHVGPLATSIDDLRLFMQSVVQTEPWKTDVTMMYCPWNGNSTGSGKARMRLGIIRDDLSLPLHPPMQRTMKEVVDKLKQAGHELIELKPGTNFPSLNPTAKLALQFAMMDPYSPGFVEVLKSGEPFVPSVAMSLPSEEERRARPKPSLDGLIKANAARQDIAESVHKVWSSNGLDAIVMPLHNTVAPRVDSWATASYFALWNLLPYPVVNVPFGRADKEKDAAFAPTDAEVKAAYDPSAIDGMPCSIQIVGNSYRDEELLSVALEIEHCLKD